MDKQKPQFISLTSAQKGTKFRINTSEIGVYAKPEGSNYTSIFMTGDNSTPLKVVESPDEIDKMMGINFDL